MNLLAFLGLTDPSAISLRVTLASIRVEAIFRAPPQTLVSIVDTMRSTNTTYLSQVLLVGVTAIAAVDAELLSLSLGVPVLTLSRPFPPPLPPQPSAPPLAPPPLLGVLDGLSNSLGWSSGPGWLAALLTSIVFVVGVCCVLVVIVCRRHRLLRGRRAQTQPNNSKEDAMTTVSTTKSSKPFSPPNDAPLSPQSSSPPMQQLVTHHHWNVSPISSPTTNTHLDDVHMSLYSEYYTSPGAQMAAAAAAAAARAAAALEQAAAIDSTFELAPRYGDAYGGADEEYVGDYYGGDGGDESMYYDDTFHPSDETSAAEEERMWADQVSRASNRVYFAAERLDQIASQLSFEQEEEEGAGAEAEAEAGEESEEEEEGGMVDGGTGGGGGGWPGAPVASFAPDGWKGGRPHGEWTPSSASMSALTTPVGGDSLAVVASPPLCGEAIGVGGVRAADSNAARRDGRFIGGGGATNLEDVGWLAEDGEDTAFSTAAAPPAPASDSPEARDHSSQPLDSLAQEGGQSGSVEVEKEGPGRQEASQTEASQHEVEGEQEDAQGQEAAYDTPHRATSSAPPPVQVPSPPFLMATPSAPPHRSPRGSSSEQAHTVRPSPMPPRGSSSPPREPSPYAPRVSPPPLGSHSPPKALGSPRSGHTAPRPLPPLRGPTSPGAAGRPPPRPATTIPLPPRPATTTPLSPRPATTTPLSPRPATTSPGVRPAPGPAPGSALPRTRSPPTAARQPLRGQPKSLLPVPLRAGAPRPPPPGGRPSLKPAASAPAVVRDRQANSMGKGGEEGDGSSSSGSNSNSLPQKATPPKLGGKQQAKGHRV